jgi:Chitobiase/beta-hexosaminidase C-terminal domain/FG-GAP-like repeat/FG-GAP repeat
MVTQSSLLLRIAASVSIALTISVFASAQTVNFATHHDYPAGYGPTSMDVGDIDGDGRADIAVANYYDNTVAVLSANPDGSFQPPKSTYLGSSFAPRAIAIGDFNRDGKADLVAASDSGNAVVILLGNGDGTFQTAVSIMAGAAPTSVAAADVNGDGKLDLAVANSASNTVAVLLGNGDGTFQGPRTFAVDSGPAFVVIADVNRDAKPDLVVANAGSGTVSVLLGNGDGTFGPSGGFAAGAGTCAVAVADINGDGIADLVAANNGANSVSVLLGNGDGSFQPAHSFATGSGPMALAAGDFNRDGLLDIAVAIGRDGTLDGSIAVFLGNGNGTFHTSRLFPVGSAAWTLVARDFNGDGAPDLAVGNTGSTTISVLLGDGTGAFPAAPSIAVGLHPESIAAGDFNGDGIADLVTADMGSSTVSVLLGNHDGSFKPPVAFAAGSNPVSVAVGDFNRDGRLDLAVANYGADNYYSDTVASTVSILLGNGDGTFQLPQAFEAGSGPHAVAVGDFNRDGILDLVVADYGPQTLRGTTVSILIGRGDGTFAAPRAFAAGNGPNSVAVGDLNGDGKQDLVVTDYEDTTVFILLGNGDGTFQPAPALAVGHAPKAAAIADLNGDGIPDLAVADHFSDTVSVLLGYGDGTFRARQWFETGRNPAWVSVADYNGDGIPDLAIANWFATTVQVLSGKGDGTFNPPTAFGVGAAPGPMALGDFDGDGQPDLAVANYVSSSVSVLINKMPRVAAPTFGVAPGTYNQPQSVALSDATTGATIYYTTDGTTPTTASPVYAGPIAVTQSMTIRAMAAASGMVNSSVATGVYTLQAALPTFTPPGGSYVLPQQVTIADASPGVTIYYTTDGTTPTTASSQYNGPILVVMTTTIKAIAVRSGWSQSAVATANYTFPIF